MTSCPDREILQLYLQGELTDEESDTVVTHVESCVPCQDRMANMALFSDAPPLPPIESRSKAPTQLPLSADGEGIPAIPGYDGLVEIGRGGMGVVYRARDVALNRLVAIKMVRARNSATRSERARLRAEAEAAARVQHPNVVPVYTSGEHDGCPYFVSEYVAEGNLATRLAGKPQPIVEAVRLVRLLARAVHAAHERGIIHRDLKPANVLLAPPGDEPALNTIYGMPKVADFGLVKYLDGGGVLTAAGVVVGTLGYMPPEQASGEQDALGPAADIYALGVILYEMLAGRRPIEGPLDESTLARIRTEAPPRLKQFRPEVPPVLEVICACCLAKAPGNRYPTARALADELERFLDNVPPPPVPARTRRMPRAVVAGLVGGLMVVLGLWGVSQFLPGPTVTSPTDSASAEPLKGYVDIITRKNLSAPAHYLQQPGVLPLHAGEWMRLEAELNRPAYVYVLWLESTGTAVPTYPWQDKDWTKRSNEQTTTRFALPAEEGKLMPLGPSAPGVEAILFLVRETPLPPEADEELKALFADLPRQERLHDPELRVWLENGEVTHDRGAANPGQAVRTRDLISRIQASMRGPLKTWFPYTRAVCYAFGG